MSTLARLRAALDDGGTSSEALVEEALAAIASPAGEGARTFTRVYRDRALAEARAADRRRAAGKALGPLDGLPVSIKDLFDVGGETTLAGSTVLQNAPLALKDAIVVERLRRAGAVIVGKTNMTEFAFSGVGLNPHYGTPRNPWERSVGRIPGGSSSGAAVSVTDGMAAGAVGTDTGGSVRIPAALCGLVGFKPTAERVPVEGCLPCSTTLDSIGPLARSVDCCVRLDAVLSGRAYAPPNGAGAGPLRVGMVGGYVSNGMDATVSRALDRTRRKLSAAGVTVVDVMIPELDEWPALNAGGGFPVAEAWAWHRDLLASRADRYDPRVAARIARGRSISEAGFAALKTGRARLITATAPRFNGFDALAWPTTPIVAPEILPLERDDGLFAQANALLLRNPTIVNFLDGCAISVPCHGGEGAPVGLMLVRRRGEDLQLLDVAVKIESLIAPPR